MDNFGPITFFKLSAEILEQCQSDDHPFLNMNIREDPKIALILVVISSSHASAASDQESQGVTSSF
jgi:hypothetical protein